MPTVEFRTGDFLRLVGKKVPLKEVEERAAMLGTGVEEVTEDRIVVEVFPNRLDMLSVEGFARAFGTFIGVNTGLKGYKVEDSPLKLDVDASVKGVRPYIVSAVVKNIDVTEDVLLSIIQIQEALHGSHGRKRAKVAIGIHDFDRTTPPYEYKAVDPESRSFIPLDKSEEMTLAEVLEKHEKGSDYKHILKGHKLYPVVLDQEGVVSLPPIINADRTRVTSSTNNLFIEMTGTNKLALKHALNIVVTSLADRGGQIVAVKVGGERNPDLEPEAMTLKTNYVNKLLGLNLGAPAVKKLLGRMGYGVGKSDSKALQVLVPAYRADILHPMDLAEDVAIAYGYENFKPERTDITTVGMGDEFETFCTHVRMLAVGLGFQEVVPFVLTNEEKMKDALMPFNPVTIKNPRTEDFTLVRTSIVPSLLDTLAYNKKKKLPLRIFELDDVVKSKAEWQNDRVLGMAIMDNEVNFSDMQSVVEALLRNIGVKYNLRESKNKTFIDGRCGDVVVSGKKIGVFGEVHPQVLDNLGLDLPVVLAEIDVKPLVPQTHSIS
jgi:phenylalanyl-tRNA synthetase beta chain